MWMAAFILAMSYIKLHRLINRLKWVARAAKKKERLLRPSQEAIKISSLDEQRGLCQSQQGFVISEALGCKNYAKQTRTEVFWYL
jgi:hypothetical protein